MGTPNFGSACFGFSVCSREPLNAYAAMPVLSYRGVTSVLTTEAHKVSRSTLLPFFLKTYQLKNWRAQTTCRTEVRRTQGVPGEACRLEVAPRKEKVLTPL
ncbi:MAG: hypothetical protein BWX67_00212 [Thermotogae bacterium ADurb.Bin062]|nr:MAG: hypothetical protein BWX67_00212 [Thermotogota bacterium ADurb.Bin062]